MEHDPTAIEPDEYDSEGEPDRDTPPEPLEEPGSDELMDPEVLKRISGE